MNSEKPVSPEILSVDNDHHEEDTQDDTCGTKRSYECTFCKRGFTNAQALGGHMNIHRKDRAKAKQFTLDASPSINKLNTHESTALPLVSEILNLPTRPYSVLESQKNSDMQFHPPASGHALYYEFYNPMSRPLRLNQHLRGSGLSLQNGPSHVDDQDRRGNQQESEVDLELRLGHDPY